MWQRLKKRETISHSEYPFVQTMNEHAIRWNYSFYKLQGNIAGIYNFSRKLYTKHDFNVIFMWFFSFFFRSLAS